MKKYLLLWLLLPSLCFAQENIPHWKIIPEKTHIHWTASYAGKPVTGTLAGVNAVIQFDPQKPEQSKVAVTIAMDSIQSDDKNAAEMLRGDEWLATAQYPTATFVSEKITHSHDKYYEANGTITIRGVSKPVTFPFTVVFTDKDRKHAIVGGNATLFRLDYGIGTGEWADKTIVENAIKIDFQLEAEQE